MKKTILTILLMNLILLASINLVAADDTFTIKVTGKHIIGNSGAATYGGPLFILQDTQNPNPQGDCLIQPTEYYNIHIGDTVTLKLTGHGYCEVISINNQQTNNGWF